MRMKTMEPCGKALPSPTTSDTGKPGSVRLCQLPADLTLADGLFSGPDEAK